ncbi:hypothetical protein GGR25_003543 [Kaistia hirudinis]|uniref:DUF1109 family protein n=1 Tax=Kaistia hirudinis TaxID=1293440 RepID=A0A840AVL8_9HYPH|nr:DUF1109 domain-containing protein [Kaistia hirudinis]MBB3932485.1 hypothetical protein [Kaistia hirudinis]
MKTNDLIRLLEEDAPAGMSLGRRITLALLAGVVVAALLLIVTVGLRHNLASVFETARVIFKVGETLLLAILASALVYRIGKPDLPARTRALMLLVPLGLLVAAVVTELALLPPADWVSSWRGQHAAFCVFFIPVLALAPLAAFLAALKAGAPENPALAGAAAGLAAGAIAAAVYAWHCPDDSPLFVATWYVIAIGIVTAAGGLIGRRSLAW